ncbi:glycerate kinase [Streptococcus sp. zg-86]|uniref:Glycerate kinase n=1 Tax=Streptococcus zhangguiae TaxID=2664091 RepID=A0A6I4RBZ8_9STRE|nr:MULTISPECIES: glycerate kinase [unclassified Streptococcus]MTB65057.1 glycerate kinase [Streptococcus sp. zg-86]MTB91256.1 glycerate kinase [Streptococcus sp. zg-36]MWV57029.1 glycerate kinase [Streptococcus sp. zg-70]QTH47549.1 glycerate kinase [Streptococcus sp. zg-86]
MKIVSAIDSFKGSATSVELNQAVKEVVEEDLPETEVATFAIGDGGEGTLEALAGALDGKWIRVATVDLLERPIEACYFLSGQTAFIEAASVVGVDKVKPTSTTVEVATSFGLGAVIRDALNRVCKEIVLTLGGTGTSDGGRGLLASLTEEEREQLQSVNLIGLTDVRNVYAGPEGYAHIFGPQKGANQTQVESMDKAALAFVQRMKEELGIDLQAISGTGAAGGLGGALVVLGGELKAGFPFVAEKIGLNEAILDADLIITGEGRLDSQSLNGKVPVGVADLARSAGVPTIAICGSVATDVSEFDDCFLAIFSIQTGVYSLDKAMRKEVTLENVRFVVKNILRSRFL